MKNAGSVVVGGVFCFLVGMWIALAIIKIVSPAEGLTSSAQGAHNMCQAAANECRETARACSERGR